MKPAPRSPATIGWVDCYAENALTADFDTAVAGGCSPAEYGSCQDVGAYDAPADCQIFFDPRTGMCFTTTFHAGEHESVSHTDVAETLDDYEGEL